MAVTSIATGAAANWYCARCQVDFHDPDNNRPCPRCRQADELEEIVAVASQAATRPAQSVSKGAAKAPSITSHGRTLGLGALAIGVPLWLEGARTTRDGWVLFLNWVLGRLGTPYAIPSSALWSWWLALSALALLGFVYSHIEVKQTPMSLFPWRVNHTWQVWVVWLVFIVSDVGTMYLGARAPREGDPAFLHQIASGAFSAVIYAIIITFIPERLVLFGWRKLRG